MAAKESALVIGLAVVLSSLVIQTGETVEGVSTSSAPLAYQLNIFSNQGLADHASSGTGTASDPYVIKDLSLAAIGDYAPIITITGTTLHFVLRNATLYGTGSGHGLEIAGVMNATVEGCTFIHARASVGTVRNVNIHDNSFSGQGIEIGSIWAGDFSWYGNRNITLSRNTVADCEHGGIKVYSGEAVIVHGNSVRNCSGTGISIETTNCALISDNNLTNDSTAISLWNSNGIFVVANDIRDSITTALTLSGSSDIQIHHNNIMNSSFQISMYTELERAKFSLDYPLGGNYWENYSAVDLFSGADQNQAGPDGIVDKPLNFTYRFRDEYPLVAPFTRTNDSLPPIALLTVYPFFGRAETTFTLFAGGTWDSEDPAPDLDYRWDLNNDGVWDTDWSHTAAAPCKYTGPENGTARLMVKDSDGLTSEATGILKIDRLPPLLTTDFGPGKVMFTKRQPIWLNWSCMEDVSGLVDFGWSWLSGKRFRVMVNGYELGDINCPVRGYMWGYGGDGFNETSNLTLDPLPDGSYEVVIQALDKAGNIGELTLEFQIVTNPLHPLGPYGAAPFVAFIIGLIVVAAAVVYLGLRPRKTAPRTLTDQSTATMPENGERARRDSNP